MLHGRLTYAAWGGGRAMRPRARDGRPHWAAFGRGFRWALIALLLPLSALAEVRLETRLEPQVTPFHRPAQLTVTLYLPVDTHIALPKITEVHDGLEIVAGSPATEVLPDGRQVVTQQYTLDPDAPGSFPLPPLEVVWGEGHRVVTPPLLFVARPLTDAELAAVEHFEDIVLPGALLAEQQRARWGWIALAGALIALAGLAAAYLLWGRRGPEEIVPVISPWEAALKRLRDLRERQLAALGKYEQFYVDLSSILRFYVEDRYSVHAPEQTTPEFLEAAARSGFFSDEHQRLLASFLRHADRVKFARLEPTLEEMEESFAAVQRYIEETVPRPEPATEAAA